MRAAQRCCSPCCGLAVRLVSHARLGIGRHGQLAQGRDVLLGHDHVLADPGHGARRLDGRRPAGLGYTGGAHRLRRLLALVAVAYFRTRISRTTLFWAAFILTRPLGAVVGDFLDKPLDQGGLALSRYTASAALLACIIFCVLLFPLRPARESH